MSNTRTVTITMSESELRMLDAMVRKWNAARNVRDPQATRSILLQDAINGRFRQEFPEYDERLEAEMKELIGTLRPPVRPDALADRAIQTGQVVLLDMLDEIEARLAGAGAGDED